MSGANRNSVEVKVLKHVMGEFWHRGSLDALGLWTQYDGDLRVKIWGGKVHVWDRVLDGSVPISCRFDLGDPGLSDKVRAELDGRLS